MTCDILRTVGDGDQVSAGYIELNGKVLSLHPKKGYERYLAMLLDEPNRTQEGVFVAADEDPVQWFSLLPVKYNGERLRARINA